MVWYGWVKRGSAGSARLGQVLKGRVMRCDALLGRYGRELFGSAETGSAGYVQLGTGCNVGQ